MQVRIVLAGKLKNKIPVRGRKLIVDDADFITIDLKLKNKIPVRGRPVLIVAKQVIIRLKAGRCPKEGAG